ncbi:MAG: Mini-ribonuclease 3 [Bacillota bacterium]
MRPVEAAALSPALLAYLGDAVYELFIRETLLAEGVASTRSLHRRATALVCAPAQARMARLLAGELSAEEAAVFRRGRNAHCGGVPAAATVTEYRLATGLESLVGFLYLTGRNERLRDLLTKGLRRLREEED